MNTGYGLDKNKTMSWDALKEFGRDQGLYQDRPNHTQNADGDWNNNNIYNGKDKTGFIDFENNK